MCQLSPVNPAIDVTVCIVNWNGARWLPDCLRSLQAARGLRCEIVLVDNASDDRSVDDVREQFPEVEVILNSANLGYAKGNNQAIRRGRGRYFLILNNDTSLYRGSLQSLVEYLDEHPRAGMVAGRLLNPDGSTQFAYYPVALPTLASLTADLLWLNRIWPHNRLGRGLLARNWDPEKPYQMEQIPGACMLVRREAFEAFGLFDEDFHFWYEDVDLCTRCLRAGWEIGYVPGARVLHSGGASAKHLNFSTRSLLRFRSMLRYAQRYFSPTRFFFLRLVVGLVLLLRLPIVVLACLWPSEKTQRIWQGGWESYIHLLGELVTAPGGRHV